MAESVQHIHSAGELKSVFDGATYTIIDFYADWCPPCKQIAPFFERLAAQHALPGYLAFAKVNVDHVQDVSRMFRVTAMPTFLFFKNGKQVAVHGQAMLQGAIPPALTAAAQKLGGLALKKKQEDEAAEKDAEQVDDAPTSAPGSPNGEKASEPAGAGQAAA